MVGDGKPRVFAPDEEIPFHFTANEINAIIGMVENSTGFPLRVTAPLREKILAQLAVVPPRAGDGMADPVAELMSPVSPPSPGRPRRPNG